MLVRINGNELNVEVLGPAGACAGRDLCGAFIGGWTASREVCRGGAGCWLAA